MKFKKLRCKVRYGQGSSANKGQICHPVQRWRSFTRFFDSLGGKFVSLRIKSPTLYYVIVYIFASYGVKFYSHPRDTNFTPCESLLPSPVSLTAWSQERPIYGARSKFQVNLSTSKAENLHMDSLGHFRLNFEYFFSPIWSEILARWKPSRFWTTLPSCRYAVCTFISHNNSNKKFKIVSWIFKNFKSQRTKN